MVFMGKGWHSLKKDEGLGNVKVKGSKAAANTEFCSSTSCKKRSRRNIGVTALGLGLYFREKEQGRTGHYGVFCSGKDSWTSVNEVKKGRKDQTIWLQTPGVLGGKTIPLRITTTSHILEPRTLPAGPREVILGA